MDAALTVTLYALLFSIVALAGNIMGRMAAIELPLER